MNLTEAAEKLREMYETAPDGEKAVRIHLFGIKYAGELAGLNLATVAERAGISRSYGTEINKGRNLARYVELKQ